MPSVVSIDSYKLEPAPIFSINKVYNRLENHTSISAYYNITISFTMCSDRGSPRSKIDTSLSNTGWGGPNKQFWINSGYAPTETITADQKLASIIRKQEALRQVLDSYIGEGHHLEVQSADGSYPLKAQVTLEDLTFSEGIWVNTCNCNIVLRANKITVFGLTYDEDLFEANPFNLIESFSENWQFDTDETPESQTRPRTYRTTHTLNCKGITKYDNNSPPQIVSPAWVQAKQAVFSSVYVGGFGEGGGPQGEFAGLSVNSNYLTSNNLLPLSGVRDLPSYYVISNHVRNENIDKTAGTYQLTEQWILASGRSLFDWTIQKNEDTNNPNVTVNIEGTITGLEERNPIDLSLITSKFTNADVRLSGEIGNFHGWCQSYGGVSLNPLPVTKTIGKNPNTGVITLSYGFDNRPSTFLNGGSGVKSEKITIGYTHQGQVYAEIFVLGRALGPVLQDLSTKTAKRKSLNISAVLDPQSSLSLALPDVSAIVAAVTPTGSQVFSDPPEENLSLDGSYNYSRSWVFET